MRPSLQRRLLLGMLLGMILVLAITGVTVYSAQQRHLYASLDQSLLDAISALTVLLHVEPHRVMFDVREMKRLPAGEQLDGMYFQFWSDELTRAPFPWDEVTAEGRRMQPPRLPDREADESRWRPLRPDEDRGEAFTLRSESLGTSDLPRFDTLPRAPRIEDTTLPDGQTGRIVGLTFHVAPRPPARRSPMPPPLPVEFSVSVATSTAKISRDLQSLAMMLGATGLIGVVLSTAVAWLVTRRGLAPMRRITHDISAVSAAQLDRRVSDEEVPRELDPVVRQLNTLLDDLQEAFDRERTLTADMAHELRTPLAGLRSIVDVALSRPRDACDYQEALGETSKVLDAMQRMVEKLLLLSRLEVGQQKPQIERVRLKPVLEDQWQRILAVTNHRRVILEVSCPENWTVDAEPHLLDIVISNVLQNAAQYTPEGGRITAQAVDHQGEIVLKIANPGCTLGNSEIPKIFDRFWRGDSSRTASGTSCGLGLTLVRRAVEAMGHEVAAELGTDNRFVLSLTFKNEPSGH